MKTKVSLYNGILRYLSMYKSKWCNNVLIQISAPNPLSQPRSGYLLKTRFYSTAFLYYPRNVLFTRFDTGSTKNIVK